jgi:hypothetical protein
VLTFSLRRFLAYLGAPAVAAALCAIVSYAVAGDWQELPTTGTEVYGSPIRSRDRLYLEAEALTFLAPDVPSSIGYTARFSHIPPTITPWPVVGAGMLSLINYRVTYDMVLNGREIGDLYDFVFRDSRDDKLVFGMRARLATQPDHQQDAELNFLYRYGFGAEKSAFSAAAAWVFITDQDMRMYSAARTVSNSLTGPIPYDPDTIRARTNVNLSEGIPDSGMFLIKSDATGWRVSDRALGIFQAGQEGQTRAGADFSGFVPWHTGDGLVGSVSEPGALTLLGLAFGALAVARRRAH